MQDRQVYAHGMSGGKPICYKARLIDVIRRKNALGWSLQTVRIHLVKDGRTIYIRMRSCSGSLDSTIYFFRFEKLTYSSLKSVRTQCLRASLDRENWTFTQINFLLSNHHAHLVDTPSIGHWAVCHYHDTSDWEGRMSLQATMIFALQFC